MMPEWCDICDRSAEDIPAEVRVFEHGVCLQCWLESVTDGIHDAGDIPAEFHPLLPRPHAAEA